MNIVLGLFFLAATTTTQPSDTAPFWLQPQFMLFAVIILAFFMMTGSGKGKKSEDKKRKELLASLKRGDRIETIGGILASVVEVRDTDVLLKIDESTNTKVRMMRDAIKRVVAEESDSQSK